MPNFIKYPEYPSILNRNYDYEVEICDGEKVEKIPVYNTPRQKDCFSNIKDSEYRRFCEFGIKGEVEIRIKSRIGFEFYAILPSTKEIPSTYKDGVISFKISKPQNLVFRLDDKIETVLAIFAEEPLEVPDGNVIHFKAGLNNSPHYSLDENGMFVIPENTTLFLDPGALVMARCKLQGGNTTVLGAGAFMDCHTERGAQFTYMSTAWDPKREKQIGAGESEKVKVYENVTFKGVKYLDAFGFNFTFQKANNLTIDNVKLLSSQISTDVFSFWGGHVENVEIKNCYSYCCDDVFVIQTAKSMHIHDCLIGTRHAFFYPEGVIDEVIVENCDLFQDGSFIKCWVNVGESPTWRNLVLRNIHCDSPFHNWVASIRDQKPGEKNITVENVYFSENEKKICVVQNCKGVNLTFNNVYIGNTPVNSNAVFTDMFILHDGNTVNYGTEFDPEKAKVYARARAKKYVNHNGARRVYVGGWQLPNDKVVPFEKDGTTFVAANELEKALNIGALPQKDGLVDVKDLEKMGLKVTVDGDVRISAPKNVENLLSQTNFDELKNPFIPSSNKTWFPYSNSWNVFAFAKLMLCGIDSHSGECSMSVFGGETQSGIAQNISAAINKYQNGTYRIRFFAKLFGDSGAENKNVRVGFVQGFWRVIRNEDYYTLNINDLEEYTLTDTWQEIVRDVKVTDWMQPEYKHAYLYVGSADDTNKNKQAFLVDDFSLTYLG